MQLRAQCWIRGTGLLINGNTNSSCSMKKEVSVLSLALCIIFNDPYFILSQLNVNIVTGVKQLFIIYIQIFHVKEVWDGFKISAF